MDYAYEIRRQAEAAPRVALPAVASALWKAFGEGHLSEPEAVALSGLIEARQSSPHRGANLPAGQDMAISPIPSAPPSNRTGASRSRAGSRPRTDASMERRRRWAASGRLPPAIAARFTLAEQAVLALVAAETVRRKDCRLAVGHLAAITGVAETTVRNAIREARKLGIVTVEERRVTGFRNDTNVVRIVAVEWTAWLRLTRKGVPRVGDTPAAVPEGIGCKSAKRTPTDVPYPVKSGVRDRQKGCRRAASDLSNRALSQIRESGRTGRAMR